jgi:hypothetical protein
MLANNSQVPHLPEVSVRNVFNAVSKTTFSTTTQTVTPVPPHVPPGNTFSSSSLVFSHPDPVLYDYQKLTVMG